MKICFVAQRVFLSHLIGRERYEAFQALPCHRPPRRPISHEHRVTKWEVIVLGLISCSTKVFDTIPLNGLKILGTIYIRNICQI
jgi:hypothetical protein